MVKFSAHRREPILAYQLLGYIYHLYHNSKDVAVLLGLSVGGFPYLKNGWFKKRVS
jgi:hypothetical protein